ncbi:MAG: transcription termination/antitermination factor NusG [Candidatus Cloacimonetes bacterium]|nr:transcription termination/antitermination factor NusG [Candidatus Cloacimonadota bacterium]MBL7086213.1 transcription termination/antitermination factor NusG [Candidatus Cloacimonadota bacterium]
MTKKEWYVLHTYVSREKQVKEALEKFLEESELKDYFGAILISSHKTFIFKNGKKLVKEKKIFPNYILIEMAMTPETYNFVLRIPGATKFLGSNKVPKPLSEAEINRILGVKQDKDAISRKVNFLVDSRIKIIEGPFNDFEGTVERIIEDKEKLVVNVSVFGRITPVEVNFNQVESLD